MTAALPPVPDELLNYFVREAWYRAMPQRAAARLAHTLASAVRQSTPEGTAALDALARWLRGQATAADCQTAADLAWEGAGREWDRAAPLMGTGTWESGADDPRAVGDAAAAASYAAKTATADYPGAAARADSYSATILGWPEVRRLLEREVAEAEPVAALDPAT